MTVSSDAPTLPLEVVRPTCPLCGTVDKTVTHDTLRAGATWNCGTCGQTWSATRLETADAYARYVVRRDASHAAAAAVRAEAH